MNRVRFFDFRVGLASIPWAAPVGLCPTDLPALAALANLCQERLVTDPLAPDEGWWGGWVKAAFTVTRLAPTIVTPRDVARVILLDVCKQPVFIRNQFWEFLEFGRGYQPKGCRNETCDQVMTAYERETVPTLADFTGPATVRIYPGDNRDVGKTVILQGADQNGATVTATNALTGATTLGEQIALQLPFVDSVNTYSTITGIQKDVTFGNVQYHQVSVPGAVETNLSEMQPGETTGLYRKYFIHGLPKSCCNVPQGTVQVLALCKLDLVPVVSDPDYLLIQSLPAMYEEAQCVRLSSMEDPKSVQLAAAHHGKALQLLNGQLDHFLGKTNTAVRLPIFGSDRLRPQPV